MVIQAHGVHWPALMSDGRVQKAVERVARGPWLARAAGFGFVAKGVVYAVIGSYALMLATGQGGGFLDARYRRALA